VCTGKYIRVAAVIVAAAASAPDTEAGTFDAELDTGDIQVLRQGAAEALALGEFGAARLLYDRVSELDRTDAYAVREAGRAAEAIGDFVYAADALGRADALANHAWDPELHYLRGEALYALGDRHQARREHDLVLRELTAMAPTRRSQLWLARVYARRGELARADAVYRALPPPADRPVDEEMLLYCAEAHVLNHDWSGARQILGELLARLPDHERARDMLAATLEASGHRDDELALREAIARHPTTTRRLFDYGRALERSGDFAGALRAYGRADRLAGGSEDPELRSALRRMAQRNSMEVATAVVGRSDPQTTSLGVQVGIAAPFGRAQHLALGAWHDRMAARAVSRDGSAGGVGAALVIHRRVIDAVIGGQLGYLDQRAGGGSTNSEGSWSGFASARGQPTRHLKLALDGEVNALWRDTPLTLLEGGHVTAGTANVYGTARDDRVIVNAGARRRHLRLSGLAGRRDPTTSELLGWTGIDVVAWVNFAHALEGGVLDDSLFWPAQLVDSLIVSYRHYELRSDAQPEFLERISMVTRASIDEGSLVARRIMAQNRIGIELRGGLGWDHSRDVVISRVGASLLACPTRSSRIALTIDVGAESPNGFQWQGRTGWVSYHADL
jgi:tetratricopeptide (TPR) repeat protein